MSFALLLPFLLLSIPAQCEDNKPPEQFIALFNGKDLAGWKVVGGKKEVWGSEKGVIYCQGGGGGYLMTDKEYGDFEFRVDYRWTKEGGNSGIGLRCPESGNPSTAGMEIQLIDDETWEKVHKFKLAPTQHTGSIYDVKPASKQANKPVGEWNTMRIVCQGRQVLVELNGEKLVEANLDDFKDLYKKHPGLERTKGTLGLQSYNIRVEYKNLFLKDLTKK
jgi:hypothetical protein